MKSEGFAYAAMAAVGHSCIDASRKVAAQKFTSTELVGIVGFLDAVFLSAVMFGTGMFDLSTISQLADVNMFLEVLIGSACIKVVVGYMYQRALQISPLSVTVPYLAFTPVLLVFTSYVVMRESPSSQGLLGVAIVTLGGYLLAVDQSGDSESKKSKGPKAVHPSESFLVSVLPNLAVPGLRTESKGDTENDQDVLISVNENESLTKDVTVPARMRSSRKVLPWKAVPWTALKDWILRGPLLDPILALRKEQGSLLMLGVAALLSLSNSFDKLGAHMAPSFIIFAALQRILMAIPVVFYLAFTSPSSFKHLFRHFPLMAGISIFECGAILCYLKSLETLLVAYSIAAKRSNVLLSVIVGHLLFKERICKRLPYVFLMVGGMILILLA